VIKLYDKVKMHNGKYAIIVEVLEQQKAYIADIEIADGEYATDVIFYSDISAIMVEVEQPISRMQI